MTLSAGDILGPSGRIAARLANYERRPQQLEMAEAVARAITGNDIGPGALFQDVSAVLTVGATYTLNGLIGSRADLIGSGEMVLQTTSGAILVASGPVSPTPGTFQAVSLTYSALSADPHLGESLRVVLHRTDGHQANFDDIQFTATIIPEPSTLLLGVMASVGLFLRRRRRS